MNEKIINILSAVFRTIVCIIGVALFMVVLIILFPFLALAKLYEKLQPRNTLWL